MTASQYQQALTMYGQGCSFAHISKELNIPYMLLLEQMPLLCVNEVEEEYCFV